MALQEVKTLEDYAQIFGVGHLFIFKEQLGGCTYVGLECGCTWDDEHGLGFVLHRDRVVAFGQADTGFNSWEARDDIARQTGNTPEGNPIEALTEDMEELTEFLKESTELQTKAREKLAEVKLGKRWWEFWK